MNLIKTKGQKIAPNYQSSVLLALFQKSHIHSFQKEKLAKFPDFNISCKCSSSSGIKTGTPGQIS